MGAFSRGEAILGYTVIPFKPLFSHTLDGICRSLTWLYTCSSLELFHILRSVPW